MLGRPFRLTPLAGLLALPLAIAGCASGTDEDDRLHLGWYELTAANGLPLPVTIQLDDVCTLAIQSGYLRILTEPGHTFRLEYRGPAECDGEILDGQTWVAYYTGLLEQSNTGVVFRIPDLSHLGLDSLTFTGERLSQQRLRTVVPQLPAASGPPVTLLFEPVDGDPRL